MTGYILRRLAQSIVVLLLVSMIVFGMLHELPGGTARAVLGERATNTSIARFTSSSSSSIMSPLITDHAGRVLRAAREASPTGKADESTSLAVLKSIDWAVANGASSCTTETRQWRSVANAAASPSQKRLRERRTYQFERSSTNAWIARPAVVAS